jgi:hypothetical protein
MVHGSPTIPKVKKKTHLIGNYKSPPWALGSGGRGNEIKNAAKPNF